MALVACNSALSLSLCARASEFHSDVSGQPVGPFGFLNPDDGTDRFS